MSAQLTVAALALVAVAAAGLDAMNAGCCESAQAQTQIASAEPTLWDHNGSVMYLVAAGPSREFYYQKPRSGRTENIPERHIFLTRIADKSRSKSKDRFSRMMNELC